MLLLKLQIRSKQVFLHSPVVIKQTTNSTRQCKEIKKKNFSKVGDRLTAKPQINFRLACFVINGLPTAAKLNNYYSFFLL